MYVTFKLIVFFSAVDMGTVLKVVSIPRGTWHDLEEVLLEEMTVFRVGLQSLLYRVIYNWFIIRILFISTTTLHFFN